MEVLAEVKHFKADRRLNPMQSVLHRCLPVINSNDQEWKAAGSQSALQRKAAGSSSNLVRLLLLKEKPEQLHLQIRADKPGSSAYRLLLPDSLNRHLRKM